jgi:DNA-binding CsgD family transcriptional regulator
LYEAEVTEAVIVTNPGVDRTVSTEGRKPDRVVYLNPKMLKAIYADVGHSFETLALQASIKEKDQSTARIYGRIAVACSAISEKVSDILSYPRPRGLDVAHRSSDKLSQLTKRELEVLWVVSQGKTNAQTSQILGVTEQTIKYHLGNIYPKLEVSNRTEASRVAFNEGIQDIDFTNIRGPNRDDFENV